MRLDDAYELVVQPETKVGVALVEAEILQGTVVQAHRHAALFAHLHGEPKPAAAFALCNISANL
jgi:hypothetical protein